MNSLDLFILIPIIAGFTFGLFKGLVKELTSLAAVVLGIYGAKFFSPWLVNVLVKSFDFSVKTAQPTAYFLLFIVIVVGLLFLSRIVDKVFESMSLGGLNKFFGGLFGALKYALILSVLINVFNVVFGCSLALPSVRLNDVNSLCVKPSSALRGPNFSKLV
jgi:membrane protein required for colicin V production